MEITKPIAVGPAGFFKEKVVHWDVLINAYNGYKDDGYDASMTSEMKRLFYSTPRRRRRGGDVV